MSISLYRCTKWKFCRQAKGNSLPNQNQRLLSRDHYQDQQFQEVRVSMIEKNQFS